MRKLILLLLVGVGMMVASRASAQTQVPINTLLQNTNNTIAVVGFCNATNKPKDLEGWVGQASADKLIASLSGTGRQAITVIVPPLWFYKISVVVPSGGSCQATIWTL